VTSWDVVLRGGRVLDPESGTDAIADVAIAQGEIAAVGPELPSAPLELEVSGLVVTAGFVDLHSHVNDVIGLRLQALDGVTTALELEAGITPVDAAYRNAAADGRPVNYGFATSWALARMRAVAGIASRGTLSTFLAGIADPAWQQPGNAAQGSPAVRQRP
jgi:N-acyl-D-aspartate/D-glutamate deacylase